jgi:ABC-type phosphate transport system auxiliary subunit
MLITIPDQLKIFTVSKAQLDAGNTNMYSVGFRNLIENHLPQIRTYPNTKILPLEPKKEQIFTGNFYGLLYNIDFVQQDMFWITMRVNDLLSPLDYSGNLNYVIIPSRGDIELLLQRYKNSTTM